jgi:release factor glutamine methyltransferase
VQRLGFCDRVYSCLADGVQGFDLCNVLVVANLPYIRSRDIELLQPEIRCWEPISALDGGHDGLVEIRKLIDQLVGSMARGVVLEIGANHGPEVVRMLQLAGFDRTDVYRDFSGFPRVVTAQRTSSIPV